MSIDDLLDGFDWEDEDQLTEAADTVVADTTIANTAISSADSVEALKLPVAVTHESNQEVCRLFWVMRNYVPCTPVPSKPCHLYSRNQVPRTLETRYPILSKPCTIYPKLETMYPVP